MAKKQKNPKGKHFVRYVDDSSPKIKFFTKKTDASAFVEKFLKKHTNPDEGYWVDFICYGVEQFVIVDPIVEEEIA